MTLHKIHLQQQLFKRSSITYYYSSLFFPKRVFEQVATLYAFVRTADNYVDHQPINPAAFFTFREKTWQAFSQPFAPNNEEEKIICDFVTLAKQVGLKKSWIIAFFAAMEQDIPKNGKTKRYTSLIELQKYIHGSAEVIGLMMCQILHLPTEARLFAKKQGAAMQIINFIRDIEEDCNAGRTYLAVFQNKTGSAFCNHSPRTPMEEKHIAHLLLQGISVYRKLQNQAEKGYVYIPYKYRVPIATAAALYNWTATMIEKDPTIVFRKKVKPNKIRVFLTLVASAVKCLFLFTH